MRKLNKHKCTFHCIPCSDLENELPLYCPECYNVQWYNGDIMTQDVYNSHFDENGKLIGENPSWRNKT